MADRARIRRRGLLLAAVTAVTSGVAVFVNGYGVRAWSEIADAATYTTAKNVVTAFVVALWGLMVSRGSRPPRPAQAVSTRDRALLAVVAVVGGSVPFVLFFEGLARADPAQAAFLHKTLVIWVAILATLFLRERIGLLHVGAITLLVWGQIALGGGVMGEALGTGELMILGATVLWSVEVILAKKLLSHISYTVVARARMVGGSALLLVWALIRGLGVVDWSGVMPSHIVWVLVTGILLSVYVLTWLTALSMAPAVDVTSVLVGGALITAILQTAVRGAPLPAGPAMVVLLLGVAVAVIASLRRPLEGA